MDYHMHCVPFYLTLYQKREDKLYLDDWLCFIHLVEEVRGCKVPALVLPVTRVVTHRGPVEEYLTPATPA